MADAIIAIIFKQLGICTSRFSGFRFPLVLLSPMLAACSGGDDQAAPTAASPVPALLSHTFVKFILVSGAWGVTAA